MHLCRTWPGWFGLVVVALLGVATLQGVAGAAARPAVIEPPPPVSASDFPIEPAHVAPTPGDGLIPNPRTPTGSALRRPSSCSVTFRSAQGATSDTVNAWIEANEDTITATTTVCLAGTFTRPLHVWSKSSPALLVIAPAPGGRATLDLGQAVPADTGPNQYWSDAGGMSIVDSRGVEVYGLTIENYTTDGTHESPAGVYVTVRSDTANTDQSVTPHRSACFLDGGTCDDIYILRNTIRAITNTADEDHDSQSVCNNGGVDAYGIAVIAAGGSTDPALQHVVVEGNTVTGTRTGQSETATFNGNLTDFLVADNTIHDVDNIGIDTIGWEVGASQANHGWLLHNAVYNVDTYDNAAYGRWTGRTCKARQENAAGIYDDGGSFIWIDGNRVWNSNQGINLDVETRAMHTDHLLVSENVVHSDPGTSAGDPSLGTNPPGEPGSSTVAGHDPYAFYVDAFGTDGAYITDVYAHDNVFQNESQFALRTSFGLPVVDIGGKWSDVLLWHNTVLGMGATDRLNPLFEVDRLPSGGRNTVDCNDYDNLSSASDTVNGNFALRGHNWLTLAAWQAGNRHRWDADSAVGAFSPACPVVSLP